MLSHNNVALILVSPGWLSRAHQSSSFHHIKGEKSTFQRVQKGGEAPLLTGTFSVQFRGTSVMIDERDYLLSSRHPKAG
jgi:hypothetical protein